MPEPDLRAGSTFIWLVTCVLFISIAAGGGCLALYVMQPHSPHASWLPFAGVAFVCLPWLFWMLTCFYRVVSRSCGFRDVGIDRNGGGGRGAGGGGGGGGGGPINVANAADNNMAIEARAVERPPVRSPESDARRRAQFEAILGLDEQDDRGSSQGKKKQKKSNSSSSHSSNDSSVDSRESEMPLTSSMAS